MKRVNRSETRDHILRDLWLEHGCPEKMTIHVRKTGETIAPVDGLPVTEKPGGNPLSMRSSKAKKHESIVGRPVTHNRRCETCQGEFSSTRKDAKYCSPRCRKSASRRQEAARRKREADRLLSNFPIRPTPENECEPSFPK